VRTKRANVQFVVKESGEGTPWISMEALGGDKLDMFKRTSSVGFDLKPGTTLEQANEIAAYLRKNLVQISES
jgi:hypothetical protein